jgi:hypothetical protein
VDNSVENFAFFAEDAHPLGILSDRARSAKPKKSNRINVFLMRASVCLADVSKSIWNARMCISQVLTADFSLYTDPKARRY